MLLVLIADVLAVCSGTAAISQEATLATGHIDDKTVMSNADAGVSCWEFTLQWQ